MILAQQKLFFPFGKKKKLMISNVHFEIKNKFALGSHPVSTACMLLWFYTVKNTLVEKPKNILVKLETRSSVMGEKQLHTRTATESEL